MRALCKAPCTPGDQIECKALFGQRLESNCARCPKVRAETLSPWAGFILRVIQAQDGGLSLCPGCWDHLPDPLGVWSDIGMVRGVIEEAAESAKWQALAKISSIGSLSKLTAR